MPTYVLDQAGLDLLLAHPHIVHVSFLAIAATQSRVDSPCSWQTLQLGKQLDVRTVAHVPLYSLQHPLPVHELLLPPDVDVQQATQLLLTATTRMASHKHLFSLPTSQSLLVTDHGLYGDD
jgi:hypothetical protein